jgi:hypothetical protein|tara:strand:- start:1377 stop:1724 length:348 start_codon:yes stop_codon:yes gene_type:complete
MTKVLENIKGHFKQKLNGELLKLTVDEWKTDIYYKPVYSFAVESKIIDLQAQGKTVEALVESVINKALTPDGKPMFHKFDKVTLMNEADPSTLIKVASALNNATSEYKQEDVEKN